MRAVVVATTNQGKIREIQEILGSVAEIVVPNDLPLVVEDGTSLMENAYKKAKSAADYLGIEALAEDTGLFVFALDGLPGVRSARYSGPQATDATNREKLLMALEGSHDRRAYFETVICLCKPGQSLEEAQFFVGRCEGNIALEEKGDHGFGYDSIFVPLGVDDRTFAQMSSVEKSQYSHRAKAIKQFANGFA